jgi:ribose 5-phosphate isomerase B
MSQEDRVRRMVRRVVYRTLGRALPPQSSRGRALVSEMDMQALPADSEFAVPPGALLTPLARQVAMDRRIRLAESTGVTTPAAAGPRGNPGHGSAGSPAGAAGAGNPAGNPAVAALVPSAAHSAAQARTVAIGSDHAGYGLKEELKGYLLQLGFEVVDCGTDGTSSVDYPDFALAVAQRVAQAQAWRGIVLDGAGIGSCMAANKVPGVRAAMCYDLATALNSREHNDANVLTLGAGLIGPNLARQIVKAWLEARFGGDRHARRIDKITQIERRYCR